MQLTDCKNSNNSINGNINDIWKKPISPILINEEMQKWEPFDVSADLHGTMIEIEKRYCHQIRKRKIVFGENSIDESIPSHHLFLFIFPSPTPACLDRSSPSDPTHSYRNKQTELFNFSLPSPLILLSNSHTALQSRLSDFSD
jgi:hypothetical protein